MRRYLIFDPLQPGIVMLEFSENGDTEDVILQNIIHAMRRGKHTEKGYALRCVPDIRNRYGSLIAKEKDCVKLGKLFAPRKNRGSNIGLRKIDEKNRCKGRDWETARLEIERMEATGFSVSKMARRLGVSPSTLSKANKRHNLYAPKQPPCK